MLFTSFSQLIVLVILFFGGLVLGLGLHPGGRKWRRRFQDESENYAQFRRDADLRLRDANHRIGELERENASLQDSEATARQSLGAAQVRMADMERQRRAPASALSTGSSAAVLHPLRADDAAPLGASHPTSAAASAFPAAMPVRDHRPAPVSDGAMVADQPKQVNSWFGGGDIADLERIRGIDTALKTSLSGLGVTRFEDITDLSQEDEMALEQRLALPVGYITREQWREQAALLRDGHNAEHVERFSAR